MQRVDGSLDTLDDLIGILGDEFGHIFQGESDGIDALDDPVMEILADALALIEDGEPMDLLVRRAFSIAIPACRAKVSTRPWSLAVNSSAPCLFVRYRLPTDRPFTLTGTPRKLVIGG